VFLVPRAREDLFVILFLHFFFVYHFMFVTIEPYCFRWAGVQKLFFPLQLKPRSRFPTLISPHLTPHHQPFSLVTTSPGPSSPIHTSFSSGLAGEKLGASQKSSSLVIFEVTALILCVYISCVCEERGFVASTLGEADSLPCRQSDA
jgi:hypothetical protein